MADKVLHASRQSQRRSTPLVRFSDAAPSPAPTTTTSTTTTPPRSRNFTLDRKKAREIADLQVAESLGEWLSQETSRPVAGLDLNAALEDGVVLCMMAAKFGQVTRYKDPPANEFQRMQNFELFKQACSRMGMTSAPPPSRRGAPLSEYIPCLLELAALAKKHGAMLPVGDALPEAVALAAAASSTEPPPAPAVGGPPPRPTSPSDASLADVSGEEDDPDAQDMNALLGSLHELRVARQRAKPPKLRLVRAGGKELMVVERPGEAVGSILWDGATILVNMLSRSEPTRFKDPATRVLELGAGVGLCGIWAASEGSDVVVTDLPACVDLLWANVAANANAIVKAGGSCSARALDFGDAAALERLVAQTGADGPLTILASDVLYNDTVAPLSRALARVFRARPDTTVFVSYKPRNEAAERPFFDALERGSHVEWEEVGWDGPTIAYKGRVRAESVEL